MITHVAIAGTLEGALGLGLDVVDTAARLLRAGRTPAAARVRSLAQRVVSVDGAPVRSTQGRLLAVDGALDLRAVRRGDVVVLPGVLATTDAELAALLARPDLQRVLAFLPRAVARGAVVAASCSATFFLAAAGLLDGRSATTTWWLMPAFARRFPRVELRADRVLVDSGGVLTAGAAFAHTDLMLAIVARVTSPSLADLVARYLVLDRRPSQARYLVLDHLRTADPAVRAVEELVAANLARQLSLAELARAAGTSPRTLARRLAAATGLTPQRFAQRVRVAHAAHLLETTRDSVEDIAARVGYADSAAFRRAVRRHTGRSPRDLRAG